MQCNKCSAAVDPDDSYRHAGRTLCEDCYLDIVTVPKTCDPWAVYSAKNLSSRNQVLTPLQERIMALLRVRGPITAQEICSELNISEDDFRRNFATLRHLELARGCKKDGQVCYTLFQE